ncbi:MAG: TOMM precursor leader peptide-binding protein [Demequinaceae bacterium]|nr:TOMM precursor leader peptide-binding protein [Demequinaceae bacterium]
MGDDDAATVTVSQLIEWREYVDPDDPVESVLDVLLGEEVYDGIAVLDADGNVAGWLGRDAVLRRMTATKQRPWCLHKGSANATPRRSLLILHRVACHTGHQEVGMDGMRLKVAPAWSIGQQGAMLRLSGGADALYEVDTESTAPSVFATVGHEGSFTRSDLSSTDARVLDQLLTAEIVVPVVNVSPMLRVHKRGDDAPLDLPDLAKWVTATEEADLLVVVRTGSPLPNLLEALDYANVTTPHLLIDAGFHHTVSIGPLVFPGETACLACLHGRVTERWGVAEEPPEPLAAHDYGALVAALAAAEIARFAAGDTSLAHKTVVWNMAERTATSHQLLRVALCAMCGDARMDKTRVLEGAHEGIADAV